MKPTFFSFAATLILFTAAHASIDWDGDTSQTSEGYETWEIATAVFTATPPTIDGVISAGEWDAAPRYELEFTTHSSMDPESLAAAFRVMWDEDYIHILIEGTDGMGIASAGHKFELYISTAYTRKFGQWMLPGYEENDYQITATINPLDTFYELGLYSEQTPLQSFLRANTVAGDHYVSEVKIAWSDLGGLPAGRGLVNSDYIGFDVHVQRGTENNNRAKLAWAAPVDVAWASTEDWGTLRLLAADDPGPGPVESLWIDVEENDLGFKETGIGWIMDSHYPHVFALSFGGWLTIEHGVSALDGIHAYDHTLGAWIWASEDSAGWFFNLSDPASGSGGWHRN